MIEFVENFAAGRDYNGFEEMVIRDTLDQIIEEKEVLTAIDSLKSRKSPDLDGIPVDLFKEFLNSFWPHRSR